MKEHRQQSLSDGRRGLETENPTPAEPYNDQQSFPGDQGLASEAKGVGRKPRISRSTAAAVAWQAARLLPRKPTNHHLMRCAAIPKSFNKKFARHDV